MAIEASPLMQWPLPESPPAMTSSTPLPQPYKAGLCAVGQTQEQMLIGGSHTHS